MSAILADGARNWRTTLLGAINFMVVAGEQIGFLLDELPETITDWNVVVSAAVVFVALFSAKDGGTP